MKRYYATRKHWALLAKLIAIQLFAFAETHRQWADWTDPVSFFGITAIICVTIYAWAYQGPSEERRISFIKERFRKS